MNRKPLLSSAAAVLAVGFLVLFIGGGARFAIGLTLKSVVEEFGWGARNWGSRSERIPIPLERNSL